jgi:hypothetical protein
MERQLNFASVKLSFPDSAEPITHWLSQELQRFIHQSSGHEVKVEVVLDENTRGESDNSNKIIER